MFRCIWEIELLPGMFRHLKKEVGVMQQLNQAFQENIVVYQGKVDEVVVMMSKEELSHRYF